MQWVGLTPKWPRATVGKSEVAGPNNVQGMKLGEISSIRSGYTFRKPPPHTTMHSYPVIQIKDVSTYGKLDDTNLAMMQLPAVPERFFLRTGDILFCARGTRNQAAVCEFEPKQAVVGSQFFVIHITREGVFPQYIALTIC